MTAAWLIFEIAINVFQSCLFLAFLKSRVTLVRPSKCADLFCVLGYTLFFTTYLHWDVPITDCAGALILLVYLRYVSLERWHILIFWAVVKEVVAVATVGFTLQIVFVFTSATHELIMTPGPLRVVFVVTSNLALLLVFFALSKLRPRSSPLKRRALLLFVLMNATLLFAIEMIFSLQVQQLHESDVPFFAAYGALIACSVLSIVLFHLMTDTAQRHHEAQLALTQSQLTAQHQEQLKDLYTDLIARQHDFKQHLQTLEQLAQGGHSPQAAAYWAQCRQSTAIQADTIITGSMAVDALLTAKRLACQRQGVDLQLSLCPLSELPIREAEFCTLVGNLLDNAIEGALRVDPSEGKRYVHIAFSRAQDMFLLNCENSMQPQSIRKHADRLLSSKEMPALHGFGIPNMKAIVRAADGFYHTDIKEGRFYTAITIPYPLKED